MSVTLINPFDVPEGTGDEEFSRGWQRAADYMREQPGFVSSRLHRALAPDARFRFVNIAEWESPRAFQAAVSSEQFREIAKGAGGGSPRCTKSCGPCNARSCDGSTEPGEATTRWAGTTP